MQFVRAWRQPWRACAASHHTTRPNPPRLAPPASPLPPPHPSRPTGLLLSGSKVYLEIRLMDQIRRLTPVSVDHDSGQFSYEDLDGVKFNVSGWSRADQALFFRKRVLFLR